MEETGRAAGPPEALREALGYFNFSSGATDARFLRNINEVFRSVELGGQSEPHEAVKRRLVQALDALHAEGGTFADDRQARAIIRLLFDHLLPAYRSFHRDLLFHQKDANLWRPFFLGRAVEAILRQGPPWDEAERITDGALGELNDFVGYRPVAVLESDQKIEPYPHEWVRPIPLYVDEVGVAVGPYQGLIDKTLELLRQTDPVLLGQAWFNPEWVREVALDPRAYDFDHPVNRRPNYHFGTWDLHQIDNKGRYRRFVLQQVTLDALLSRMDGRTELPKDELLLEAAAVLAGTMLMASATTGSGPETHDSSTALETLLPHIAHIRDQFYEQLLQRWQGPHAERLREEAAQRHQPFGGARQHLNQELAHRRATQVQRVQLAQLFARMGYPEAALRQAHTVRVASARMLSQIYCRLTAGHHAIDARELGRTIEDLLEIEDLLHRAIECGALMDPWNIVGFGGNFSLFPALSNSIRDYRTDDLIELMEQIFGLCARAEGEAAAIDDRELESRFSEIFARIALWWDRFATPTVTSVKPLVGKDLAVSTNLVAGALNAWQKAGAGAGDVAFWRLFVDQFDTPKAFQLVVEALLERNDAVASMALLMQWLSQAERTSLEDGDSSFHQLAVRWMRLVAASDDRTDENDEKAWSLVHKFFELLEANAEEYWQVARLELAESFGVDSDAAGDDSEHDVDVEDSEWDDEESRIYGAAYDEVTYEDSADDGVESEMLESGVDQSDFELQAEARRLGHRLVFHTTLARMWRHAAIRFGAGDNGTSARRDVFCEWSRQASAHCRGLLELLAAVHQHRVPAPSGEHESMVEYDRRRMIKEVLIERIVSTSVEMRGAQRLLRAVGGDDQRQHDEREHKEVDRGDRLSDDEVRLLRAVLAGDVEGLRDVWPAVIEALESQEILYVPLSKGGNPRRNVRSRALGQFVYDLVGWLPRLGMVRQTRQLLETAQRMETLQPVGPGAITEFDRLFENGYKAIVRCLVASTDLWSETAAGANRGDTDQLLVEILKQLTEIASQRWLRHSRTVRLSVVEKVSKEKTWNELVDFVSRYGRQLFRQQFLNLGNVRAILHQGVGAWLAGLNDIDEDHPAWALHEDWSASTDDAVREQLVQQMTFCLETIVENYTEYRDYNSTTTQSDRGEMIYTLFDFLRLRTDYDRVAWNLKPVMMAHEVLTREGRNAAAEIWRRELAKESQDTAARYLARLEELCQKYGMRLPSITERLSERFVRPLGVDRVRALVRPAMDEAMGGGDVTTFSLLQQEIEGLANQPTGMGMDHPSWLEALEEEVGAARSAARRGNEEAEIQLRTAQVRLDWETAQAELED